jgi:hypothetical protein
MRLVTESQNVSWKGDWLRATRHVTSVKKSKVAEPPPFFSGPWSYGFAGRKKELQHLFAQFTRRFDRQC